MSQETVKRARELIGVRFRPQGRHPNYGLDCLGVVVHACQLPSGPIPTYSLRGDHASALRRALSGHFEEVQPNSLQPGDVLLLHVAREQVHMAVHCGRSIIHADARAGRVVETPGTPDWPIISVHRRRVDYGTDVWQR